MPRRYDAYLASPHWREFRRAAERQLPRVCACGATKRLQLHHMTYERLGHERLEDVAWLCARCHKALHKLDPAGGLFNPASREPFVRPDPVPVQAEREQRIAAHRERVRQQHEQDRRKRINAKARDPQQIVIAADGGVGIRTREPREQDSRKSRD